MCAVNRVGYGISDYHGHTPTFLSSDCGLDVEVDLFDGTTVRQARLFDENTLKPTPAKISVA